MTATVVLGTRPEAVKLAPVVHALHNDARFRVDIVHTGQHAALAADVLGAFDIVPTTTLELLRAGQGLADLLGRAVTEIGHHLAIARPDVVVVQGDTTTAAGAALAATQSAVPVVHVEAGLRSGDRTAPFPEEDNRRIIAAVADLHLPPTAAARGHLLAEGIDPGAIVVTGNTGIDALDAIVAGGPPADDPVIDRVAEHRGPVMLVTTHRRESWGATMAGVADAVRRLVDSEPDLLAVVPMHPNPRVRDILRPALDGHRRVILCEPLPYAAMAHVLASCTVVMTDSGGLQEEAPRLGVPVLVLRRTTERPEAVEAGAANLVGVDAHAIEAAARAVLHDPGVRRRMGRHREIFGDGRASTRAVQAIGHRYGLGDQRPTDFVSRPTPRPRHGRRRRQEERTPTADAGTAFGE